MKSLPLFKIFASLCFLTLASAQGEPAASPAATNPPASGELFHIDTASGVAGLRADNGAVLSIADHDGKPAIKVEIPASTGYPGITFPSPAGGWNLSGCGGVQIDLTNPGTEEIAMTMRAENALVAGEQSPWSVQVFKIKPGTTQTLKVIFGRSFGGPGFAIDKARITAIKLYPNPPKTAFSVLLANLKGFKQPGSQAAAPAATAAPAPSAMLAEPVKVEPPFSFADTPPMDIAGKHDFPDSKSLDDGAATQLKSLCSLAEFEALPEADRHVYSFDPWPGTNDSLDQKFYTFNFLLGTEGVTNQKVAFIPDGGGPGGSHQLHRTKNPASPQYLLGGFGNLDWNGTSSHVFKFDKPVIAFGVVLRSSGDVDVRKFYWQAAKELNGYPVSYTLADGTIVQLGERDLRGALLKGGTDAFLGVIDRSGCGIISVSYTIKGLAGNKAQSISMCDLAFATLPKPAVAPVINLKSSCDFDSPGTIAATPNPALKGLATLDAFRFIVGNHRYVYHFDTWPQKDAAFGSDTGVFSFDLKGKGSIGQKVTVTAANAANDAKPAQATLKDKASLPYHVLGGLGDIGNGAWSEQTFKFDKPVWGFGVTYRSPNDVKLAKTGKAKDFPVSYTLSDGTVVNLGKSGDAGGVISANGRTFVGVIDDTDKGISSITMRVQGTAKGSQPIFMEDLAFAMAGPPPGDWKITLDENFDGNELNPKIWSTGYKFVDVINSELQGFVPENVTVANGVCTIKTEVRDCNNTDRYGRKGAAQKFASGAFTSYDKFTQTYGYFEARIKMPHTRGAGIWPAFWLLPDRGKDYPDNIRSSYGTKDYGRGIEIDIFEFMPWWKRLDGTFPVHMGCIWSYGKVTEKDPAPHGYGAYALDNDGWGPKELDFPSLDTQFHTYGLYWSPERLIFYVDSRPVFRVKDAKHMPDVPHYVLFNISVHPNGWGKSPDKKNPTYQQILDDMPNDMQIDYFRAYSGTLEEAVPPSPSDIPGVVTKYSPPPKDAPVATPAPAVAPSGSPAAPANGAPDSPANSHIVSPSNG